MACTPGFQSLRSFFLDSLSGLTTAIRWLSSCYFSHNSPVAEALYGAVHVLPQPQYPCPVHSGCTPLRPREDPGARTQRGRWTGHRDTVTRNSWETGSASVPSGGLLRRSICTAHTALLRVRSMVAVLQEWGHWRNKDSFVRVTPHTGVPNCAR